MPTTTIRSTLTSGTITCVTKRIILIPSETVAKVIGFITDDISRASKLQQEGLPPTDIFLRMAL